MYRFLLLGLLLLAIGGCRQPSNAPAYVARVGSYLLTEEQLREEMARYPMLPDSLRRQRAIAAWVDRHLLLTEAEAEGIPRRPDVVRRLREFRKHLLIEALVDSLLRTEATEPLETEIHTYYEQHKEEFRLTEPYYRIRLLTTRRKNEAEAARRALQQAQQAGMADSVWTELVHRYAADTTLASFLASRFLPRGQLPTAYAHFWNRLPRFRPGQISDIVAVDTLYAFFQLVDRLPEGTLPEISWVADRIRQEVRIRKQKQFIQRHVQRLKHEAQARNALEIH